MQEIWHKMAFKCTLSSIMKNGITYSKYKLVTLYVVFMHLCEKWHILGAERYIGGPFK